MHALGMELSTVTGTRKARVPALMGKPSEDGLVSENFAPWG